MAHAQTHAGNNPQSLTVEALLEGVSRWVFGRALQQGVQVLGVQVLGIQVLGVQVLGL